MAEGWTRRLRRDVIEAFSAGVATHGLNPRAVQVMQEAGVDITDQRSQHIDEFADQPLDFVVTVCGDAAETCPVFPGSTTVVHHGFDDPPALTRDLDDDDAILAVYRRVRDEIREYVTTLPTSLAGDSS